jgi:hypothetical protein
MHHAGGQGEPLGLKQEDSEMNCRWLIGWVCRFVPHRWREGVCLVCGKTCLHPSFTIFVPFGGGEKVVNCEVCRKKMRPEDFVL